MAFKATEFTTETGRIVWTGSDSNSLYDPCTTDFDGNPLKPNDDGSPGVIYRLGLAIPKKPGEQHWANSALGQILWAQGHRDHPQAAGAKDFSWKVQDGDSTEKSSKAKTRPCDKEGYPGHWVYTVSSGFPFKFVDATGANYLLDRGVVKVGDYVQIAGTTAGNTGKTPGIYINHRFVSLQYLGKAIVSGPDPKTLGFGHKGTAPEGATAVGALNVGASPPPPPPQAPAAPAVNNAAPPPPGGAPAIPGAPPPPANNAPPPPQTPVTPSTAFVGVPAAPGAAPPPPPPAQSGPKMTAKAGANTYAMFIAGGWTDADLRANGYMA